MAFLSFPTPFDLCVPKSLTKQSTCIKYINYPDHNLEPENKNKKHYYKAIFYFQSISEAGNKKQDDKR